MDIYMLLLFVCGIITLLFLVGSLFAIGSALIMYYLPSTKIANWLNEFWFDPVEPDEIYNNIGNVRAGDCITKKVTE